MSALLHLDKFSAAYGEVPVVRNVSLDLAPGEIMALTGRNGMGKTTLLRGIIGLTSVRRGTAQFAGADLRSQTCLLYTSPSPRDRTRSRMPSSA